VILEKLLIDAMGTGLGIFVAISLFDIVWIRKNLKRYIFICGIILFGIISVILTTFLQNALILPLLIIAVALVLSFYYVASFTYRILLSLAYAAIIFVSEVIVAVISTRLFSMPIEEIQSAPPMYIVGVLGTNLFALFMIFIFRAFFKGNKNGADRQFNLLMAFMPMQSIILCYIVAVYSIRIGAPYTSLLGVTGIFLSMLLIFITMLILSKHQSALEYKKAYELEQERLKLQIEHSQELYHEQQRVRSIRHDMNDSLIAISGMLEAGQEREVLDKIKKMHEAIKKTTEAADTGLPALDAIITEKKAKAKELGIEVECKAIIDDELHIDQFDIAVILANALDNAIEGIERSTDVDRKITMNISREAKYISILVKNPASGLIHEDYKTSKSDDKNHGFGMAQMKNAVQKYDGSFLPSYDSEKRLFLVKIMLENKTSN